MLNHAEISLLLSELDNWRGAAVQKIQQSSSDTVTLTLRRPGQTGRLQFALQRGRLRFHFVDSKPPSLQKPPSFSMALRKYISGGRLVEWSQPPGERIARFTFANRDEPYVLVAELIPPGGNLVLLSEKETVLARLFNDGRNGAVGKAYRPPEPLKERTEATVREWSGDSFHAYLADEFAGPASDPIDEKKLRQAERKREKLLRRLDEDWEKAGDPELWRERGDLLMTLPKGQPASDQVLVPTDNGDSVAIDVDSRLSIHENAERFYRLAKKADSARRHIRERRRLVENETAERFVPSKGAPKQPAKASPSSEALPPGHVFRWPGGSIVAAGRSADENERITYGFARNEDYWLHARGVPGSHVVVRHSPEDDLESLLDDAARVALNYSFRRGEAAGDVQVTRKKYVQRVKGAPGKVNLRQEENRRVTMDDESIALLMKRKVHKT